MKPPPFGYVAPATLEDAVGMLAAHPGDAKVLAGGQSLVPMLNMRLAAPGLLVDVTRVAGLDRIEVGPSEVRVGAAVTQERVRRDAQVRDAQPVLTEALGMVAHAAVRSRGTVVGSLVHADPAAEMPALLALTGGYVELCSAAGSRDVPASELFLGPLESAVRAEEVAVAAVFPLAPRRTGSAFVELTRRHGDFAIVGVAASVTLDPDGAVQRARVVFVGAGPTPATVELTEALAGVPGDALDAGWSPDPVDAALDPPDDVHATAAYRRHLAHVLSGRALRTAAERARAVDAPITRRQS